MSEERRKCIVTQNTFVKKGYFEKYGETIYFDDAGQPYVSTVAIVETIDGQVITVPPECIKFINN